MFGFKKGKVRISVITWDACFRESFHTVDFFGRQQYPKDMYEIIWVDYYKNVNPVLLEKVTGQTNLRILTLEHDSSSNWHIGECINEGVRRSSGEVLVIPDGDIILDEDFLSYVWETHTTCDDLVVYFRRYDEPLESSCHKSRIDINYLKRNCVLSNPTNYGGCLTLKRKHFELVNGYETHEVMSGPGMIGMETHIRLRNAGLNIRWARDKCIYHPWHTNTLGTGFSDVERTQRSIFLWAKAHWPWINPGHFRQSWIIHCREIKVSYRADAAECEDFLELIPHMNLDVYKDIQDFWQARHAK